MTELTEKEKKIIEICLGEVEKEKLKLKKDKDKIIKEIEANLKVFSEEKITKEERSV